MPQIAFKGLSVYVDGRELPHVRSFDLRVAMDSVAVANVEVIATEQLDIHTAADLHVSIHVDKGMRVVEEKLPDGRKSYRAEAI